MTPVDALEIRRLASLWSTARTLVHRVRRGEVTGLAMTPTQARNRLDSAEDALLRKLDELVQASAPHPVHPDNADAHAYWQQLTEGT